MRVCLVCLDNLGDMVFTSSLVKPIMERYPDARWTILCKDYAADIARAFPVDADVVAADPWWSGSPGRGSGRVLPFLRAVLRCGSARPDITIVTSTNWRASAVARLIGSPVRVGFDRKKSARFLTHKVSMENWATTPITVLLARLLKPCGVVLEGDKEPLLALTARFSGQPARPLPPREFIILHPFAGDLKRCWPLESWGRLARLARGAGYAVIWMGREDEVHRVRDVNPDSSEDYRMCDLNRGELAQTLAITAKARCLIGHDSGPLHFAAALNVPVLGFYLPSLYPQTVTRGLARQVVLHRENPSALSFEDVASALRELVPDSGSPG